MAIEKLAQVGRALSSGARKAGQYVKTEAKEIVANHTQIGRRLREGVHNAREAVSIKMEPLADDSVGMIDKFKVMLTEKGQAAIDNLRSDKRFINILEKYAQKRKVLNGPGQLERRTGIKQAIKSDVLESVVESIEAKNITVSLENLNNEQFIQEIIETLGVGSTKAAQIFADNPVVIKQIEEKFGKNFVNAMLKTKKNCFPTRTLEEAQEAINQAFPGQNITIKSGVKSKTASIGETYFVKREDGSDAVVKMLKKGLSKEQLEYEEQLLKRLAKEFTDSPKEYQKIRKQLTTLYEDWAKELNFEQELANNKLLSQGAKRFNVAKITGISPDKTCIVMDNARGISYDDLLGILKDYRANPAGFAERYADKIAANPWLADPEKVARELPTSLLKAFDEQFMFMKQGGQSIMHGDPHSGNFFITQNAKGKLIPEFIDTGSCVVRSGEQIADDISFFSNYFVGNSRGVAEYLVKQAGPEVMNKELYIRRITKDIQNEIFGKIQNVRKFSDVQANLNYILEKHGLQMSPESITAMKAQLQFFSNVSQAGKLTGQQLNIMELMKDIPQAAWGLAKNGTNPWGAVKDDFKFAFHNQKQAVGTAYQFTIKDVDKVLKSDGTLAAMV